MAVTRPTSVCSAIIVIVGGLEVHEVCSATVICSSCKH